MIQEILKLGNPELYEISGPVLPDDYKYISTWVNDLHDTLINYKNTYGAGRAIAAPQIGIKKRLIYMFTDKEYVIINPILSFPENVKYEVMDDCMSFPGLCVKVLRYKKAILTYEDLAHSPVKLELEGDYSELIQHEYDHLDGILSTMRAIDNKSYYAFQMKR